MKGSLYELIRVSNGWIRIMGLSIEHDSKRKVIIMKAFFVLKVFTRHVPSTNGNHKSDCSRQRWEVTVMWVGM